MLRLLVPMPGYRVARCPGVFFVGCFLLAAWGCDTPALERRGEALETEGGTVRLDRGVALLDVRVSATGGAGAFEPDSLLADAADVVRFVATDAGAHAVAFDAAHLSAEAWEWLTATGQFRGPPLIQSGAAWVITLEGAPPGPYPFVCRIHGNRGLLTVRADEA